MERGKNEESEVVLDDSCVQPIQGTSQSLLTESYAPLSLATPPISSLNPMILSLGYTLVHQVGGGGQHPYETQWR